MQPARAVVAAAPATHHESRHTMAHLTIALPHPHPMETLRHAAMQLAQRLERWGTEPLMSPEQERLETQAYEQARADRERYALGALPHNLLR
jgi:hypothetical protein